MGNKTLTKSNNKMLAGVCGGVAEFFGWNPTLVRVIWAFCLLFFGFGIVLYIVLWIVMPKAPKKSYQDRMQERLDKHRNF